MELLLNFIENLNKLKIKAESAEKLKVENENLRDKLAALNKEINEAKSKINRFETNERYLKEKNNLVFETCTNCHGDGGWQTAPDDGVSCNECDGWGVILIGNCITNNEVIDILNECLNNQQEIINSPIRFNGISEYKLTEIFKKHGISLEPIF